MLSVLTRGASSMVVRLLVTLVSGVTLCDCCIWFSARLACGRFGVLLRSAACWWQLISFWLKLVGVNLFIICFFIIVIWCSAISGWSLMFFCGKMRRIMLKFGGAAVLVI